MNIFELHENPIECVRMHCDKHIVKIFDRVCSIIINLLIEF